MNTEKQSISLPNGGIMAGVYDGHGDKFIHLKSEGFDPESLWVRVDGDLELLRELVDVFAPEAPKMLARIQAAIDLGSPSDLEKASHKMKGSVLQFSARAAADTATAMEETGRNGSIAGAQAMLDKLKQEVDRLQEALKSMAREDASR